MPSFGKGTHPDSILVRHREYLRDLNTGVFTPDGGDVPDITSYRLNPTDATTFPWLSPIARRFQQWRPHGIVFELVSASGAAVASTNAALGTFSMATQYDVLAAAFSTKQSLLNSHFATSARVSDNQMHPIECRREDVVGNILFCDPEQEGWEPRLDDLGIVTIWASGSQATYVAAQLWVTYEIELIKPKLGVQPGPTVSVLDKYYAEHPDAAHPPPEKPLSAAECAKLRRFIEEDLPPDPLPPLAANPGPAPSLDETPSDEGVVIEEAASALSASGYAGFLLGARSAARAIPKRV